MCSKKSIVAAIEKEFNEPNCDIDSECDLSRFIFIENVNKALIGALLDLNLGNSISYIDVILGSSLKNKEESSISLLRTLSRRQKIIIKTGTKHVIQYLSENISSDEIKAKIYKLTSILDWVYKEEIFYRQFFDYFDCVSMVERGGVFDSYAINFNRESLDELQWISQEFADKNWRNFSSESLEKFIESRNYYLISSELYILLIPAFVKEIKHSLSVATNGNFYINLLYLGNFLDYMNPVDPLKIKSASSSQKVAIHKYMKLIEKLLFILEENDELAELHSNPYWVYSSKNKQM